MSIPKAYIIKNEEIEAHISNYGVIIQKIIINKKGVVSDVVLGFDDINEYRNSDYLKNYPYFGAIMGRCANRIGGASFHLHGKQYNLAKNAGNDHLHGGIEGFDKKFWTVKQFEENSITLEYLSRDGEEGYPGNLKVEVELSVKNCALQIHYQASCDQDCFVNITHHPYFNLHAEDDTVKNHILQVFSDRQLETKKLIPTGNIIQCHEYTDFQTPHTLQSVIEDHSGLDHTYIYNDDHSMKRMALLYHPKSDIHLTVYANFPSMQVYTGEYINVVGGKNGKRYPAFSGIAFEPQMFPDAPNHSNFPSTLLTPKSIYDKTIFYDFND